MDGHGSKWMDIGLLWTVIRLKVNGPDESKDKSERYKSVTMDDPKIGSKSRKNSCTISRFLHDKEIGTKTCTIAR